MVMNPGVREMSRNAQSARPRRAADRAPVRKGRDHELGRNRPVQVDSIPTARSRWDAALGIGGVPRGRRDRDLRPESSGKTTLTLSIMRRPKSGRQRGFYRRGARPDAGVREKLG